MAVYSYKARSGAQNVTGTIDAQSPRHARNALANRGLTVRDVVDVSLDRGATSNRFQRLSSTTAFRWMPTSSVRRHDVTALVNNIATLLGVGVPLLESLDTLMRQHADEHALHGVIVRLRDRVSSGGSLAEAMSEQPRVFDDLSVRITEVGEDAGTLDLSLARLGAFRQKADQLRNRVATALIYPAIVSVVGLICTLFLMTFVVPKILQPLIEQNLALPWPTRVVKDVSDLLLQWWWLLLIIVAMVATAFGGFLSTDSGRRKSDAIKLKLPLIGPLLRKQAIVRIAVVISTLLKSGVVLTHAMQLAQRSVGNRLMADALRDCEMRINSGADLSTAMEMTGVFPPMVVQIFSLGQQSGRLEEMLDRLAESYETQVAAMTQRMIALLEPAMIVVLAGFVLFIVLATVLPILEVGNAIQ